MLRCTLEEVPEAAESAAPSTSEGHHSVPGGIHDFVIVTFTDEQAPSRIRERLKVR